MKSHAIEFSGRLLNRGFWIYVWRVLSSGREVWYVGRTGDSSSPNAASPFSRLSQHLEMKANSKGNALTRNLLAVGIKPHESQFKLFAFGPVFAEQEDFESHKPYRDQVGYLEAELAFHLRETGKEVLGTHPKRGNYDFEIFNRLLSEFESEFCG